MKRRGFTLVELLAVIAILAILVIIALPNIMGMFNSAKESTFITELKKIYRGAEEKYVKDSFNSSGAKIYSKCSGCTNELDMQIRDDLEYYIEVNSSGKVVKYYAHDNSYQFVYEDEMTINDIKDIENVAKLMPDEILEIKDTGIYFGGKFNTNIARLNDGKIVNIKLKKLAQPTLTKVTYETINNSIKAIKKADTMPDISQMSDDNILSSNDSSKLIYAWYDNGTIYYYTKAKKISIGTNLSYMFANLRNVEEIDLSNMETSDANNMFYMFYECNKLKSLDLSNFNTSNVTDFGGMFENCYTLSELDLSSFDTSNVTNMSSMFEGCRDLISLDLSNFDTSKVKSMYYMFKWCRNLNTLDLSNFNTSQVHNMMGMFSTCINLESVNLSSFNTSNVTRMNNMFEQCNNLKSIDVSNFDTSKVESMSYMFYNCNKLTSLNLSNFNTSEVKNMSYMFNNCKNLKTIYVNEFDTSNVTKSEGMFLSCNYLVGQNGTRFSSSHGDVQYARVDTSETPGYFTLAR